MQTVLLREGSEGQQELARLGRSATYRATKIALTSTASGPHAIVHLTPTGKRFIKLAADVSAYLARTLSLPKSTLPRYELAADVAALWAHKPSDARNLTADEAIRLAYVTLVAATSSDIVWTRWEAAEARITLAISLMGAVEDAPEGWKHLRDMGISIAQRSGFDLASAASNATFWASLRQEFPVEEIAELLKNVSPGNANNESLARLNESRALTSAIERGDEVLPPGQQSRVLSEPISLSSRPAKPMGSRAQVDSKQSNEDRHIRVWFATNRGGAKGGGFGSSWSPMVTHGYVDFQVDPDAVRDIRVTGVATDESRFSSIMAAPTVLESEEFTDQLNSHGATEQVMLYVHGFNNDFDDSIRRAAQLAWDIAIDAPIIVFSWPSAGSWHRYFHDRSQVEASSGAFTAFVKNLPATTQLDVLVHSMGNRLLAQSINALSSSVWVGRRPLRSLVLAAADLGVNAYAAAAATYDDHLGGEAAVYVAHDDRALCFSRLVNQGPVLGHGGPGTAIAPMESIDAARVNRYDYFRHNYFATSPPVLSDLAHVVHGHRNGARHAKPGLPTEWEL